MTFKSDDYAQYEWLSMPFWPLRAAVILLYGDYPVIENGAVSGVWNESHQEVYRIANEHIDLELLETYESKMAKNYYRSVKPEIFTNWAANQGYAVPLDWLATVNNAKTSDDIKSNDNSTLKGKISGSAEGRELVSRRHDKTKQKKIEIMELAKPLIIRGKLNHAEIAQEIIANNQIDNLSDAQIRDAVKEQCRNMNRTELILGHRNYTKPK